MTRIITNENAIIEVWPRGYAHEDGLLRFGLPAGQDVEDAVRQVGPWARVWSIRPAAPVVRLEPPLDPAYVRMMSRDS